MDDTAKSALPRLSACALGVAAGLTWGLGFLLLALLAKFANLGMPLVGALSSIYFGFSLSALGIVIGIAWALLDGFITGFIFACFYNFAVKYCACKRCHPETKKD